LYRPIRLRAPQRYVAPRRHGDRPCTAIIEFAAELPNASWIRRGICRILERMAASAETWKSYAQLLARLSPSISHIVFASLDGVPCWSSDFVNVF